MKQSQVFVLKISVGTIITLLILGYGLFQARNFISGPKISVFTPINGENVLDPLVLITGSASNITRISLDDRQIFVDKQGNFSEKLLVPAGYTIIKLAAQDKFGRTTQKLIELNYTATGSPAIIVAATSTVATSSATSMQNIIQ